MINVEGHNGQVHFDGATVTITRRGFRARTTIGGGEKRIPVQSITAVQWKPAGALTQGFVQFTLAGGIEQRSRAGSQTVQAAMDENSVLFTKKQMPGFEQLRQAVEQSIAAAHAPRPAYIPQQQMSVADELAKLHAMVQQGILSPQEFEQQKARLLR